MHKKILLTCVALCALASGEASAASFDFYKLKSPTQAGDFPAIDGVISSGGDLSSSDVNNSVFEGDLTFVKDGITVKATGTHNGNEAAVVQDKENNWEDHTTGGTKAAGLGVYHENPLNTADDNITVGEMLTLTFDQTVHLTSLELRAEGHVVDWKDGTTFLFNGAESVFPQGDGTLAVNAMGSIFTFAYGGSDPDQFYVASATANAVNTPDTGSALALFGLGLAGLATSRRRLA